jgi:glutamate dehydrogenase
MGRHLGAAAGRAGADRPDRRRENGADTSPAPSSPSGQRIFDAGTPEGAAAQSRPWVEALAAALAAAHGDGPGGRLFRRYRDAFPAAYRDRFTAADAVADIAAIERAGSEGRLQVTLYRPAGAPAPALRVKLFHPGTAIALSAVVPMLEHLGMRVIDEIPHTVPPADDGAAAVILHDIGLENETGGPIALAEVGPRFEAALLAVWRGESESDRFNALVLHAGLTWRQAAVLRAYARYLRQAGILFSQPYMEQALGRAPALASRLVRLFETLFDPRADAGRAERVEALVAAIARALDDVARADDDRIVRRFLDAILSTLRTNHFQRDAAGAAKRYLAVKLDSRRLADLPAPRPMAEIFVYAPEVEGIHLRGGRVARGGIRWSDRGEDFRSEILSLMKAQMVKNTVIVPVGAKGGFVVRRPLAGGTREAAEAQAIACYRTFISGLLDLTDNLRDRRVVPPADVVRRDDDDPYLVVAADKGTARFSDIANAIAEAYGFWLGDAFASGGSHGYDHKKLGITARGAWELIRRHFVELGRDLDGEDVTVVGVGDMSGDVFGNAMLLSRRIRLIAAFDHRHIFIDPDPDPDRSFAERARLFALPASSWQDYAAEALSPGGGVFARSAKTISLAPRAAARLGLGLLPGDRLAPEALIQAILRAPADLLWFGGIGTFVKAAAEDHAAAADRLNDAVRVDAEDLRCTVIGEGANLGLTQRARIAFARRGGRINTDFIDNAAGVATSDHEVNIKILLDAAVSAGELDREERNELLADMADEVARLVLRDIAQQGRAISLIAADGPGALDAQARLIRTLERERGLDRSLDVLPDDDALGRRRAAGEGLSRPEICLLFAESKIWLNEKILASGLPDDPSLLAELVRYFPGAIRARFAARIPGHRLRRELIATAVTNSLINRLGGQFVIEIGERTGAAPAAVARAYLIARETFELRRLWEEIEGLDGRIAFAAQATLFGEIRRVLARATAWLVANAAQPAAIADHVARYAAEVATLAGALPELLPTDEHARFAAGCASLVAAGVPDPLARRIAALPALGSAFDIVRLAGEHGRDVLAVGRCHYLAAAVLGLAVLRRRAERLDAGDPWQRAAIDVVLDDLDRVHGAITGDLLAIPAADPAAALEVWAECREDALAGARELIARIEAAGSLDLAMLTVASRRMRALITA